MAKKPKKVELFETGDISNSQKVQDSFDELNQFVNDNDNIEPTAKSHLLEIVRDHRSRTGKKTDQITNIANLNTAVGKINRYLESL